MKLIKRISIFLTFVLMLSVTAFVSAADYEAKIEIEYEISDSGNIIVTATLNDIKSKNGVIGCEYDILFDPSALELVDATVNIPNAWKQYYDPNGGDSDAENWSMMKSDGNYIWSVFNVRANTGIKDNDQLYVILEFKKLNNSKTKIEVTNGCVFSETDSLELYQLVTNKSMINIDLSTPSTPDIDTDISNPIIVEPPTSEGNDSSDLGNENDPIKIPHVGGGIDGGENHPNPDSDDQKPNNDGDDASSNALFLILGIIAAVVAIFLIVYIAIVKKNKGSKND